jgi:hypothetical protein
LAYYNLKRERLLSCKGDKELASGIISQSTIHTLGVLRDDFNRINPTIAAIKDPSKTADLTIDDFCILECKKGYENRHGKTNTPKNLHPQYVSI